ncbi:MAG: DegV family protein [Erysipelotrichales bacterium]|nr:DegV family protein [Erysipelotrichales bacterium]
MIKMITDSTSDIDIELGKKLNVEIVPLKVIFKDKEYKDRIDLQPEQFYNLLTSSDILPTTSQPSPQDFLDLYEEAKENQDSIIVLTLSSVLSGTYQSACIAKDLVEYDDIYIIDSLNATQGLRLIVDKAVRLRDEGLSVKEIVEQIEEYKKRVHIYAYVDTLEYFYKGGRLSKTSATVGTMLKLKPIVGLQDGKLDVFAKARGNQKATAKLIDIIKEHGDIDLNEPVSIGYTGDNQGLEKFEDILKEELGFHNVLYGFVGPVIGTHAGPGARLIAYTSKK